MSEYDEEPDGDFYEDDELIENIRKVRQRQPDFVTALPGDEELTPEETYDLQVGSWDVDRNNIYEVDERVTFAGRTTWKRPGGWSGLRCPTPCDSDCGADCHESHEVSQKRAHEVDKCLDEGWYPLVYEGRRRHG